MSTNKPNIEKSKKFKSKAKLSFNLRSLIYTFLTAEDITNDI